MSKYLARAALVGIAAAILTSLYLVRIHTVQAIWPLDTSHHPRVLVFVGGLVGWAALIIGTIIAVIVILRYLIEESGW